MAGGTRNVDKEKFVVALHAQVPSSATPKWVSLRGYNHIQIIVSFINATTVTGSAISLSQATAVAGTSAKALAFSVMWANANDATNAALTQTVVSGNTFTTVATNSISGYYLIEVDADTLDLANGFNAIQVVVGNATAQTLEVSYILGNQPRYSGGYNSFRNPISDV
jgi:hypothetical protein